MAVEFVYDVFTYEEIMPQVILLQFIYDDTIQYVLKFPNHMDCKTLLQELHKYSLSLAEEDLEDQEMLIEEFLLSVAPYFTEALMRINPMEW